MLAISSIGTILILLLYSVVENFSFVVVQIITKCPLFTNACAS